MQKVLCGEGDPETLILLEKSAIEGKWLNLAAGDGRYNDILLKKADKVVATDVDESALSKLYHNTPDKLRDKLETKTNDLTEDFPFKDESFDRIFCTGTLHLFPERILKGILKEIDRVLREEGEIILDFATDIRKEKPNGELYVKENEPLYSTEKAKKF